MAVAWNDTYLIWNDSTTQKSQARRDFQGKRLVARSSEARRQFTSRRYFSVDLSNLQLQGFQLEEIRAFEAEIGYGTPFLMRLPSYCLFEDESNNPLLLGVGTGTSQTLQLIKRSSIQGRAPRIDEIHFPNYNYPPLQDLNGQDWQALPPLRIWSGAAPTVNARTNQWSGNEITNSCTVDRNTGKVTCTVASGTSIYVTGGFYWKMILLQSVAVTPVGSCLFEVGDGVQMLEPFPEGGEIQ